MELQMHWIMWMQVRSPGEEEGGGGLNVMPHCHESTVFQIWYSRHVEAESILSGIGNWLSTVTS